MTKVTQIKLSKSNCYLIQGDKSILIDTGSPGESKKIISALYKEKKSLADISLILHTHGHVDHCGSTSELLEIHKIPTAIHIADGHMTERGKSDATISLRLMSKILKPFVSKPFPPFKANIYINEYPGLNHFGINGKIHLTPGHTNGSISIELDNNEMIIGDLLMGGYLGGMFFPHLPDYHYYVTNLEQVNNSITKVLSSGSAKYYVGHGGPLAREKVVQWFHKKRAH
jgi:glyoxylase-like metal-dependent hydrolase (beta-lactamase superfamily II)